MALDAALEANEISALGDMRTIECALSLLEHPICDTKEVFERITRMVKRAMSILTATEDYSIEAAVGACATRLLEGALVASAAARVECERAIAHDQHVPVESKQQQRKCLLSSKMDVQIAALLVDVQARVRAVALPLPAPEGDDVITVASDSERLSADVWSVFRARCALDAASAECAFLYSPTANTRIPAAATTALAALHAVLATRAPTVRFCVCGSHALGLATPSSDIDVVLLDGDSAGFELDVGIELLRYVHEHLKTSASCSNSFSVLHVRVAYC